LRLGFAIWIRVLGGTVFAIAEKDLADLLRRQVYPQLMDSKFSYWVGGKKNEIEYKSLVKLNTPDRALCTDAAGVIVKELAKSGGVKEVGSLQSVEAGLWNKQLCRGLGAVERGGISGPWWFEAELVKRWERVYAAEMPGKRRDKVMEAVRPMLAIRKDWNDLLRLVTMTPGGAGIPVLTAQGTHQPLVSGRKDETPEEQKERLKVVFIGGFQQVYVPFVPVQLVGNYL
jgi:hypothetical protein